MKIIDGNGRLFGKISVIDVLVILVVAVLAAALYFKSIQNSLLSFKAGPGAWTAMCTTPSG